MIVNSPRIVHVKDRAFGYGARDPPERSAARNFVVRCEYTSADLVRLELGSDAVLCKRSELLTCGEGNSREALSRCFYRPRFKSSQWVRVECNTMTYTVPEILTMGL